MKASNPIPEAVECVDPLLGTDISELPQAQGIAARWWCAKPPVGNCHPGATLPFGMVSVCPNAGCYPSGYGRNGLSLDAAPERIFDDYTCTGFAHFQQSGTGRIRMYYNYLSTMPLTAGIGEAGRREVLEDEKAAPGYYSCTLKDSGVAAELTVAEKSVTHRYVFPEDSARPVLALDVTAGGLGIEGMETFPLAAHATDDGDGKVRGWFRMEGVTVHFFAECTWNEQCATTKFWRGGVELEGASQIDLPRKRARTSVQAQGVFFEPPGLEQDSGRTALVATLRIGFSLRSGERARRVLQAQDEIGIEPTKRAASEVWSEALEKIQIEGASTEQREIFYSALYHSLLKPADFYDENPFTKRDGPFYLDFSTMWDMYKAHLPLVMMLFPERGRDIVNFLLDTAAREGNFPISYLMDNSSERFDRQGSCLAHMTIIDAFWRKIEGVDWERALRAMHRTVKLGRGVEFADQGVVHPLSHTLDLAGANWCTAMLAKGLGDQHIHDACLPLSRNWKNAYDPETGLLGDSEYYEGDRWNYSFRLLHDMEGRIAVSGGDEPFVETLDHFFGFSDPLDGREVFRFEGLNNEPDMETPYAYIYAGRHDRTAEVLRAVIRYQFTTGRGGLPGNDDSGGLSSWYVWSAIGMFPVTGQNIMLIGSPVFTRSVIRLQGGDFVIEADAASGENIYISGATLNGKPINRAFLRLDEMMAGGLLRLEMSSTPGDWARDQRPPSSSHERRKYSNVLENLTKTAR